MAGDGQRADRGRPAGAASPDTVSRAAWRLEQAERERAWALAPARADGISIRTLATAIGLSPSRVHQLAAGADPDALNAALGELRAAGWPAPEHPDCGEDTELDGRDLIADRLDPEVSWLRQAAGWLTQLHAGGYLPTVNLRPGDDWPDTTNVAVGLARVAAVLDRIASDAGELARALRAGELTIAAVLPGRRAERRRRLAEPDLDFRTFCRTKRIPSSTSAQMERAWDARQAERYRRGETGSSPPAPTTHSAALTTPYRNPQAEHRCSGNWTLYRC